MLTQRHRGTEKERKREMGNRGKGKWGMGKKLAASLESSEPGVQRGTSMDYSRSCCRRCCARRQRESMDYSSPFQHHAPGSGLGGDGVAAEPRTFRASSEPLTSPFAKLRRSLSLGLGRPSGPRQTGTSATPLLWTSAAPFSWQTGTSATSVRVSLKRVHNECLITL